VESNELQIELVIDSKPAMYTVSYSAFVSPGRNSKYLPVKLSREGYDAYFSLDPERERLVGDSNDERYLAVMKAFDQFLHDPENERGMPFFKNCHAAALLHGKIRKDALRAHKLGVMMPYPMIFPWEKLPEISLNGRNYKIVDAYCVQPSCACEEVALYFFDSGLKDAHITTNKIIPNLHFLYSPLNQSVSNAFDITPEEADAAAKSIPEGLNLLLRERHSRLKKEVEEDILKKVRTREKRRMGIKKAAYWRAMNSPGTRKLGRNEPCHCGSGRKYKKCCLDKDLEETGTARRVSV